MPPAPSRPFRQWLVAGSFRRLQLRGSGGFSPRFPFIQPDEFSCQTWNTPRKIDLGGDSGLPPPTPSRILTPFRDRRKQIGRRAAVYENVARTCGFLRLVMPAGLKTVDIKQTKGEYRVRMLSDVEIREFLGSGALRIEPLEDKNIEPASYDLRAGRILIARRGIVNLRNEPVVLRHGDWAEVESLELFRLPLDLAATVGVRSSLTRRGLIWFGGPQFDPGYRGKAYISIFNASSTPIEIVYGMPFATSIFYRLAKGASRPYDGRYQEQTTFPEDDVERMLKMESYTLSDVIQSVGLLEQTVGKLTKTSERMATDMNWVKKLLFAILIALMIGVGASLLAHLV